MDDRKEFLEQRAQRLCATGGNKAVADTARKFFKDATEAGYSYNFDWLGVPVIQFPQDLVALQEVIWRVKPDLIVETGVARGGSLIFHASMLKLLGNGGKVVGVDIDIRPHNRDSVESHPLAGDISLIQGSSVAPETVAQVEKHVRAAKRPLIILDSNHTHEHVRQELELYAPFVGKGSYLIVFDTVIELMTPSEIGDRPWAPGNSPMSAVDDFLKTNKRFEIDQEIDAKLLISVGPRGYLKCIAD